jgi:uncharacterized lipoprotein YmbA
MTQSRIAMTLLLSLMLAGCGSSPVAKFYTLGSADEGRVSAAVSQTPYVVLVGPVSVPDTVDRPQLVLRIAGNQLIVSEQARWLEPLKSAIPRAIASHLAQSLTDARVTAYPQSLGGDADYRVLIDVQRFDSALGDAATVEIVWTIRPAKGGEQKYGRTLVREAAGGAGFDALVAAHARALSAVSLEIAEAIRPVSAASR